MGSCCSVGMKFQLCKRNKFWRFVQHSTCSEQYGIVHFKIYSEDRSQVKCSYHTHKKKKTRKFLEVMGVFSTLIIVTVSWIYTYVQIHQNVYIKYVSI